MLICLYYSLSPCTTVRLKKSHTNKVFFPYVSLGSYQSTNRKDTSQSVSDAIFIISVYSVLLSTPSMFRQPDNSLDREESLQQLDVDVQQSVTEVS